MDESDNGSEYHKPDKKIHKSDLNLNDMYFRRYSVQCKHHAQGLHLVHCKQLHRPIFLVEVNSIHL